ncbi:MAG: DNA starvation/stationary phase protection protein Dps [Phycisphaerales bacterium]|nr:DNA starvation/stationary phase protection protein Dps [Phycisphaerales bacterium]
MNRTRHDLAPKLRRAMIDLLNASLVDAIDLWNHAKGAHWNVRGPAFIAVHELFDKVAGQAEQFADDLAERAVALGGVAAADARIQAKFSHLPPLPEGTLRQARALQAVADSLAEFGRRVRKAIDVADEAGDAGTADLFTQISRETDKLLWFIEAHEER